eukprot:87411-Pelagomonas_calceolata.AAC.7
MKPCPRTLSTHHRYVSFARMGGTSATFDLQVHLRFGETIEFSQIAQGEGGRLQSYCSRVKIKGNWLTCNCPAAGLSTDQRTELLDHQEGLRKDNAVQNWLRA